MAANTHPIAPLPAAAAAAAAADDADMDAAILGAGGIKPPAAAAAPAAAPAAKPAKPAKSAKADGKKKQAAADSLGFKAKLAAAVREAERATRAKVEAEMAEKAAAAKRAAVERAQIEVLKDQITERDDKIAKLQSVLVRLDKRDTTGIVESTKNQIFERHARLFNPEEADYEEQDEASPPKQRLTDASGGKRAREEERSATDELPSHADKQEEDEEEEEEEEPKKKRRTRDPHAPKLAVTADKRWVAETMPKVYTAKGKESQEMPAFKALFILKTGWDGTWAARKEEKVEKDGTVLKPSIGCMALLAAYYKEHVTAEEKAPYEKAAAQDKERFDREMVAYKAAK